jgi:hypothetical protein
MAGGFADFNSERSDAGQRHRRNKAGGGSSGISGSSGGLSQEKLDKIIAFKQKHSDRGPKTTGNQVTLILRIPFAYLPENLLGKFVSVVIEEHGVDLVSSLRSHSAFYSYFKDLTAVSSDVVGELTMPPTNMPTSYIQFIALKKDEQAIMTEDGQSFATMVWVSLLLFWLFLTGVSICCLFRARMQMKERLKMEELLSQETSSSKPLIKQELSGSKYDSWRSVSSSDEEQTVSSFEPSLISKTSTGSKSTSTNENRKTVAATGSQAAHASALKKDAKSQGDLKPDEAALNDMFGLESASTLSPEDDVKSSAVNRLSRKTKSAYDAKEIDLTATHTGSGPIRKTKSATETKSSSRANASKRNLDVSENDLLGIHEDSRVSPSSKPKHKIISASSKSKAPSSRNLKANDEDMFSIDDGTTFIPSSDKSKATKTRRATMPNLKTDSDRNLKANLQALSETHHSADRSKTSSHSKRSTVTAANSRRNTMSKAKSGSERKLETASEAVGRTSSQHSKPSSRSRKTVATDSRKSTMTKSKSKSSSSSRDLKAKEQDINDLFGIPSDGHKKSHSSSRQDKSSGGRRHTTTDNKSMLDKLNNFDIV